MKIRADFLMVKAAFFLTMFFSIFSKIQAQSWHELGGGGRFNEIIHTVCGDPSGNVFAAGNFKNISGKYYVAKWNGASWSELGGLNGLAADHFIKTICSDASGNIYAGGFFWNGTGRPYVAKWDGNQWSELGNFNNTIKSIHSDAFGNIYVGGDFTNTSGKYYVAKWNGTSWSELGGLNGLSGNGQINSICSDGAGNIYAAGNFSKSNGRYVAKWNGTQWSDLGGTNGLKANYTIFSISSDATGNIYAGGSFTNGSSSTAGQVYVAKWNGTSWTELVGMGLGSGPTTQGIYSIRCDALGNVYAAGKFRLTTLERYYVAKWNGLSWSYLASINSNLNNSVNSIFCEASGKVYAGGVFQNVFGKNYVAYFSDCQSIVPTIISSGPTTFCQGESVTLTSSSASGNIWSNDETTQSISVNTSGIFGVTVTDSACSATAGPISITVNAAPPTPTISANGPTTFCAGGSVTLTSSASSGNTWSNGQQASSIVVTNSGGYGVVVSNGTCSSTSDSTMITVNLPPIIISQSGNVSSNVGSNINFYVNSGPALSFRWQSDFGFGFQNLNNSGQYSGSNTDTLTISNLTMSNNNTHFRCIVNSGLCSDTSMDVLLNVTNPSGIEDYLRRKEVSIFPNPTRASFDLNTNPRLIGSEYLIYDNTGKTIISGQIFSNTIKIDLGNQPDGIFLLRIADFQNHSTLIIKK